MVFRQILVTNCLKRARKLFKKEKKCSKSEKLLEGLKVAPNPKSCSKVAEQLRNSPSSWQTRISICLKTKSTFFVDAPAHSTAKLNNRFPAGNLPCRNGWLFQMNACLQLLHFVSIVSIVPVSVTCHFWLRKEAQVAELK